MDLGIKDLRVLITAGASGIGLQMTKAFLAEGAKVHTCDIDRDALEALSSALPGITWSVCDVSDRQQVAAMMDDALRELGGIDCLVNNAGIAGPTGRVRDRSRRLGQVSGCVHYWSIQLHAACGPAPQGQQESLNHQFVVCSRAVWVSTSLSLCSGQVGCCWFYEDAGR